MYPFFRLAKELVTTRKASPLKLAQAHVSHHICWPWDLDFWMELNNGRTLTLYDLGRIPLARRVGLIGAIKRRSWGLTVAGATVRYRRRITAFSRIEMRSRAIGWDTRFLYVEQSMWRAGECTNHALYRMAVVGPKGIVDPAEVAQEMGFGPESPPLPQWVQEWIRAETHRPWPPEM